MLIRMIVQIFILGVINIALHSAEGGKYCTLPPNFPSTISLELQDFVNWDEEIRVRWVWTATPETTEDVLLLANWAYREKFTLRPSGIRHSWSPITLSASDTGCRNVIVVDTSKHLKRMSIDTTIPNLVSVETGAILEDLLTFLENNGYGIFAYPEIGNITIGGIIAVGAHGTGIMHKSNPNFRDGSVSNLVMEFDAVVWNHDSNSYALKTFHKMDTDFPDLLVNLGRAFLTRVSLLIGPNYNLRCQSLTTVPASVVYGSNPRNKHSMAALVRKYGRVDAQLYPYTDYTMIRLWSEAEVQPTTSKKLETPYPFTHRDTLSRNFDQFQQNMSLSIPHLTPNLQRMKYVRDVNVLTRTETGDVWGRSKNLLLYYSHLSQKWDSFGHVVLTTRENIQRTVNKMYSGFKSLTTKFALERGEYPMNQGVQVRVTGIDSKHPIPTFGFLSPVEGHPEYDVAVFFGLHCYAETKGFGKFLHAWESFLFRTFVGNYGTARVEWAKSWGFDKAGLGWNNDDIKSQLLPSTFGNDNWNRAVEALNGHDPHKVFTNEFLVGLLKTV